LASIVSGRVPHTPATADRDQVEAAAREFLGVGRADP
jgi:hypothetical protein